MNAPQVWHDSNARFLEAALEWLRLKLSRVAPRAAEPLEPAPSDLAAERGGRGWLPWARAGQHRPKSSTSPAEEAEENRNGAEAIHRALTRMTDAEQSCDPPPALALLAAQFGLTPFERAILLFCAAMELDTRLGALCACAQDDPSQPFPTFALALALFDGPEWSALAPDRPLRALRLIELHQPATTPLIAAALRIDERIVHYLKGLNRLDDRLSAWLTRVHIDDTATPLPASQEVVADAICATWSAAGSDGGLPIIQLLGPDPASKLLVAHDAARRTGRQFYRLPADTLYALGGEMEMLVRLWRRESRLLPLALYLDADDPAPSKEFATTAARFLARDDGPVIVATPEPLTSRPGRLTFSLEVGKPTLHEQQAVWDAILGTSADRLASQFHFNLPSIVQAAHTARALVGEAATAADLLETAWEVCRAEARPRVEGLAHRIEPRAVWMDLIIPARLEESLRRLASQVRHRATVLGRWGFDRRTTRGLGITALFAGPSGTGKTMAAEVLANDLRLDLYRIDLSAVVSKYIGETEKNLRRLFDSFEESGAVLFFDEADALFGRRTEVRDSHDRYANIEVNYLLQRMESYRGLAILATNLKGSLDPAFLRRLKFVIQFPAPRPVERQRIWEQVFPVPGVPVSELDTRRLAALDLTGGNIHTAALNAAYRAAETRGPVTMAEVLAAAREEYVKLERPIHEADFRWPTAREEPV